jgi:GAF domain-containing protein
MRHYHPPRHSPIVRFSPSDRRNGSASARILPASRYTGRRDDSIPRQKPSHKVQTPTIPADEDERQAALDRTGLLRPGHNADLDDIVELAAMICDVPIALVSLVDHDRQFFKASVGVPVEETPRDISFCGHAIHGTELFVVPDAAKDDRFVDNPLVTGPPYVRFYAGVPLLVDDRHAIGTLCIIDSRPRVFDGRTRDALTRLARIARLHIQELTERGQPTK